MTTINIFKSTYNIINKKHKRQVIWLAFLMLIVGFIELALAAVVSLLGVALSSPESLYKVPLIGAFFQSISYPEAMPPVVGMLLIVLVFLLGVTIVKNIITAYATYQQTGIAAAIGWDIGRKIFSNYLHTSYIWHTQQNTAKLHNDLEWRMYVSAIWVSGMTLCTQLIIMFFLMVGAFIASPWASLLLYGICGCVAVLIYKLTQAKVRSLGTQGANINLEARKTAHFALQGIREVFIYNQRRAFNTQFAAYANPHIKIFAKQSIYPPMPLWILESLGMLLLLGAVLLLYWQGKGIATITGTLTLMAGISWRLLPAMNKLVTAILQIKANIGPVEHLLLNSLELPSGNISSQVYDFKKSIEMQNIGFSYPQSSKKSLDDINLSVHKGTMVGLVGLSGVGKSTLVGVLTGLLPPNEGKILIDGKEIKPAANYLNIGYVPQNPYIIDATLAENVAFSDWGKEIDEARVLECCRMAAVTFLDELPNGIHTALGDRGIRLSGGQMQRVAIARALYNRPEILLFDEATSALDGAAEDAIQKTIVNLRENMTIVIIAHRLSTVEGCDKIYWLNDGKIVQSGSKDTLQDYAIFLKNHNIVDGE